MNPRQRKTDPKSLKKALFQRQSVIANTRNMLRLTALGILVRVFPVVRGGGKPRNTPTTRTRQGKSGGGPPQSKTLTRKRSVRRTRSVLECASPLALWAAKMRWTGFHVPNTVAAMEQTGHQTTYVTCRCQHCDTGIEFDSSEFEIGETRLVECPHCQLETNLFVPNVEIPKPPILQTKNSVLIPPTPARPIKSLQSISQTEKPKLDDQFVIIFSPGVIRYMNPIGFWQADVESIISEIKKISVCPEVKSPVYFVLFWNKHDSEFHDSHGRLAFNKPILQSSFLDCFMEDESWENKLRVHHSFGHFLWEHKLPSHVYSFFHYGLRLGKHFAFDECVASWVANAIENKDLAESFLKSPDHLVDIVHNDEEGDGCACYVFKKTDFVKIRLAEIAIEKEEQSALEEAERLRKSKFSTFIYIMQDMRNGAFKIGRSITPGKRERTLQSEVPEIVLRFSIPADEVHEKHLHDYFDSKNLRGEWFMLKPDDLIWVVSYLKQHGDIERASVNFEWLGQVFLNA